MKADTTSELADARFHALFGPEPVPVFDDPEELTATWGRRWGASNEVGRLHTVLMRRPSSGLAAVDGAAYDSDLDALVDPERHWYWTGDTPPDLVRVEQEYTAFVDALKSHDVEVVFAPALPAQFTKAIYTRDPILTVPGGAIVGRLAARMRRGEEQSIAATVTRVGVPILGTITGTGLVEGGSFQKVRPDLAFFGTSVRCNPEGHRQLERLLEPLGITVRRVSLPGYLIHLDMCASMIDCDLAVINPRLAPFDYIDELHRLGIETVEVDMREEWAANLLVLDRRKILLPDHLVHTAERLSSRHDVEVIPVPYREILKNGGGLHCSTMELMRDDA